MTDDEAKAFLKLVEAIKPMDRDELLLVSAGEIIIDQADQRALLTVARKGLAADKLAEALEATVNALDLFMKQANWGASALSGDCIMAVNSAPSKALEALAAYSTEAVTESPMTGFMATLTDEQKVAALAYSGDDTTPGPEGPEPGMGWKLSQSARDKIEEITSFLVHNVGALHGVVMANLSVPLNDELKATSTRREVGEVPVCSKCKRPSPHGDICSSCNDQMGQLYTPITMQDVRLAVGEGPLRPQDVLAGCNAELTRRSYLLVNRGGVKP